MGVMSRGQPTAPHTVRYGTVHSLAEVDAAGSHCQWALGASGHVCALPWPGICLLHLHVLGGKGRAGTHSRWYRLPRLQASGYPYRLQNTGFRGLPPPRLGLPWPGLVSPHHGRQQQRDPVATTGNCRRYRILVSGFSSSSRAALRHGLRRLMSV